LWERITHERALLLQLWLGYPCSPAHSGPSAHPPRVGRQIAGVCLAMAQANAWDVTTVRIIAVLALFFSSGLAGVAYVAAWIGIPEEPLPLPGTMPPAV
jgi:phage shock protein C